MSLLVVEKPPVAELDDESDSLVAMLVGHRPYDETAFREEHFEDFHNFFAEYTPTNYTGGLIRVLVFESNPEDGRVAGSIESFYSESWLHQGASEGSYYDVDIELFEKNGLYYTRSRVPESDCWKDVVDRAAENGLDYEHELRLEVFRSLEHVTSVSPIPFPIRTVNADFFYDLADEIDNLSRTVLYEVNENGKRFDEVPEHAVIPQLDMELYAYFIDLFAVNSSMPKMGLFPASRDNIFQTCYGFKYSQIEDVEDSDSEALQRLFTI